MVQAIWGQFWVRQTGTNGTKTDVTDFGNTSFDHAVQILERSILNIIDSGLVMVRNE